VSAAGTPAPALSWLRAVIRSGRVAPSTIAVAAVLVTLAPGRGQPRRPEGEAFDFFASVETLAHSTGCGQRTVRDALAALTDAGLLLRVRRGGRRGTRDEASTWRLVLPSNTAENAGREPEPNPSEAAGRADAPTRPAAPVGDAPNPSEDSTWNQFPTGGPTGALSTTKSVREEAKDASSLQERNETPGAGAPTPTTPTRGTRLLSGWRPSAETVAAMRSECPGLDLAAEHRRFADYWADQPGQRGRRLSWEGTWRNWMRRAADDQARRSPTSRQRQTDDLFAAAAERLGVDGPELTL